MSFTYSHVHITKLYNRDEKFMCDTEHEYKKYLSNHPDMVEDIGKYGQQIKPVIDVDAYDSDIDVDEVIKKLNILFPNKPIKYAKREPREYKNKTKYSYRFYIQNVRILSKNLKTLLINNGFKENPMYDLSIYDKNKVLFLPLTSKKENDDVPILKPVNATIFECCASYIQEDFEDFDINFKQVEEPVVKCNIDNDNDYDDDEIPDKYNKLSTLIRLLSSNRSDNFDTWIKMIWCIINICNREKISRRKCYDLIHQFSRTSKNNYNEEKVDVWIDKNYDKVKENGFGWNYLYNTCIKEDNPKYYENITQSYQHKKKEFELNNAKILYPPMVVHIDRTGENIIQPINLCEKTNRHMVCAVKEMNKKGEIVYKNKKFIEKWLDDPTIRKYDTYVFKPYPLKVENYEYNTWTNFEILKVRYEENQSIIDRFLEYLKNLFNDENVVKYILAYFANRIQNPAIRNMVCLIIYGEEGDGKNRLLDIFKNIVGDKYFTELESAKQLFGTHSCFEKEQLFICVNEAKGKDNYENSEILKARITTPKVQINPKGIQGFDINNYCDYLMTTNNPNAVNLHDKSRRYLYVETTSFYSRNSSFFNAFSNDIVDNPKALRVIYEYLYRFNIKQVIPSGNFQNHIPETEIQKDIIKNNRDKILYFLEDFIEDKDDEDEVIIIKNQILYEKWNNWVDKNKMEIKYNHIAFHTRLGILMKKKINIKENIIIKDTNKNTFINIKKLKKYFQELIV